MQDPGEHCILSSPHRDFKARWRRAITDYLLLGHVLEDLHNLAIQRPEVADVFFDPGSRYLPQKLVEQPRRMTLEEAVFAAMPTLGQNDIGAVAPSLDELRDYTDRVLKIDIHRDHRIARGVFQSSEQGCFLAKISRKGQ